MTTPLDFEDLSRRRRLSEAERAAERARQREAERQAATEGRQSFLDQPDPLGLYPNVSPIAGMMLDGGPAPLLGFEAPESQITQEEAGEQEKLWGSGFLRHVAAGMENIENPRPRSVQVLPVEGAEVGAENWFSKAFNWLPTQVSRGTMAALDKSGQLAERAAPYVVDAVQYAFIPGKQELEQRIDHYRQAGFGVAESYQRAYEDVNLEAPAMPFAKTAFTPEGSITIDFEDVIEAGLDPIDVSLAIASGGATKTVAGAARAGKNTLKGAVSLAARGSKETGSEAATAAASVAKGANLVPDSGPKRVVARIKDLDTLEETTFRNDVRQGIVDRIARTPVAGTWAKRIIGIANPAAVAGSNPGVRANTIFQSVSAHGGNAVRAIEAYVGPEQMVKAFSLDMRTLRARASNIKLTSLGRRVFESRGLATDGPFTFGDIAEYTLKGKRSYFTGLTQDQWGVLNRIRRVFKELDELIKEEGLDLKSKRGIPVGRKFGDIVEAPIGDPSQIFHYLHRKVLGQMIEEGGDTKALLFRNSGAGGAASRAFERSRTYEFMEEAARDGVLFAHPQDALNSFAGGIYRMVAEKRAADLMARSGRIITGTDALKKLYPGLVAAKESAERAMKTVEANVRRVARQKTHRRGKAPLLREAVETAEKDAANAAGQITKGIDRYERRFYQAMGHLAKSQDKALSIEQRRQSRRFYQRAAGQFHAEGEAIGRLWSQYRRFYNRTAAAHRKVGRFQEEVLGLTDNQVKAEAEQALVRAHFRRVENVYRDRLARIMDAAYVDASLFGGELGEKVATLDRGLRRGLLTGQIVEKSAGEALVKSYGARGNNILRRIEDVTGLARTLSTGVFDIGWFAIQGSLLAFTHPVQFAKAARISLESIANPAKLDDWMRQHMDAVIEGIENGLDIGSSEFFGSLDRNGLLGRLNQHLVTRFPDGSTAARAVEVWGRHVRPVGRLAVGFNAFLDVAKVNLYTALRGTSAVGAVTARELASHVNNMMGTLNTQMLGVNPVQRQIEGGLLMFSPRYTRSAFALVQELMERPSTFSRVGSLEGLASREAARAISHMIAGGTAVMYAMGQATGQEVQLNPFKPGWLTIEIGGTSVGIGGSTRALIDAGFKGAAAAAGLDNRDLTDLFDWNMFDPSHRAHNPLLQYPLNRTAPGVREVLLRETFDGEKLDDPVEIVGRGIAPRFLPFALQQVVDPPQGVPRQSAAALIPEVLGLRARPLSAWERRDKRRNEVSLDEEGKNWEDLPADVKARLTRDHEDLLALDEAVRSIDSPIFGPYFNRVAEDRKLYQTELSNAAAELAATGNGPTFRERHDNAMFLAAQLRQKREDEFPDVIRELETNRELRTAFDEAVDRYSKEVRGNPATVDEFGNIDFNVLDQLEQAYRADVGNELYQRVRNYWIGLDEEGQPLRQEYAGQEFTWALRQARERLREARYWRVAEDFITSRGGSDSPVLEVWREFESTDSPAAREALQRRYPILRQIARYVDRIRTQMRRQDPALDRALVLWYGYRAANPLNQPLEREIGQSVVAATTR